MSNPYHDPKSGEFTSGPGGSAAKPPRGFMRRPGGGFTRDTRKREAQLRSEIIDHNNVSRNYSLDAAEHLRDTPERSRALMEANRHRGLAQRKLEEHERLVQKRTVGFPSKKYRRDEFGGMIGRTRPDE